MIRGRVCMFTRHHTEADATETTAEISPPMWDTKTVSVNEKRLGKIASLMQLGILGAKSNVEIVSIIFFKIAAKSTGAK